MAQKFQFTLPSTLSRVDIVANANRGFGIHLSSTAAPLLVCVDQNFTCLQFLLDEKIYLIYPTLWFVRSSSFPAVQSQYKFLRDLFFAKSFLRVLFAANVLPNSCV